MSTTPFSRKATHAKRVLDHLDMGAVPPTADPVGFDLPGEEVERDDYGEFNVVKLGEERTLRQLRASVKRGRK